MLEGIKIAYAMGFKIGIGAGNFFYPRDVALHKTKINIFPLYIMKCHE